MPFSADRPIVISCPSGCHGKEDLCIPMIRNIVASGNTAFMIFSEHVREKVESIGFQTRVKLQHDIPIGLYIYTEEQTHDQGTD